MKVTFDKKENATYAEFFPGTFFWHMDGTYEEVPPFATVLTPRVLAPKGGQTEFANNYAAYEDLPESEKRRSRNCRWFTRCLPGCCPLSRMRPMNR